VGGKDSINKAKGVEICVNMLYEGKQRAEIVQFFAKNYGIKERTTDNYIKDARPKLRERQEKDEEIRARVQAEQTEEVARKLGLSREYLLTKLKNVMELDVRKLFKPDGTMVKLSELDDQTAAAIAGVEIFEEKAVNGKIGTSKKVKLDPRLTAISETAKLLGYTGQTTVKAKVEEGEGTEKKTVSITLNLT
jgi:phage terminase small subunit